MIRCKAGDKFSRMTLVSRYSSGTNAQWVCRCDCGKIKIVAQGHLRSGHTRSCGCLVIASHTVHGHCFHFKSSSEYICWQGIKSRCENKNDKAYRHYGGRGITVCDRWHKFENFLADMGVKPSPKHSIDRINNDGNYEPGNCRWATRIEQNRNTRKNIRINSVLLSEIIEKSGLNRHTVLNRYHSGCNEKQLLLPPHPGRKHDHVSTDGI